MIHAYSNNYVETAQETLGNLFELAVCSANMEIDDFAHQFASSSVCRELEKGNPIFLLGKSAAELLALIVQSDPIKAEHSQSASPEYWLGWTLAYAQWYLCKPYSYIFRYFPCSELILSYFPYHETDITKSVELIASHLPKTNRLRELRTSKGFSQNELALLSEVPVRSIKAYEQNKVDLSKAEGETLLKLSKVLSCSIEDLIIP